MTIAQWHRVVTDHRGGRVLVVVIDVKQCQLNRRHRPVAHLHTPLATVARFVSATVRHGAVGGADKFAARADNIAAG
ncbi:hypothetical protein D3C76_1548570 [compost metagenome]